MNISIIMYYAFRRAQRGLTEAIESCNSPLVFRRKIGGTMEQMRTITLLLKITEEFLGGVPRRGEVVIIPHSALNISFCQKINRGIFLY